MSIYLGDYAEDYADLNFKFHTNGTDGAPTTLSGTPVVSVYKSNDVTQSTSGVSLTVDFDSLTGCNHVKIDLSAAAFYATAKDYQVVITTGTVGGTSVVGYVVATFSIENRFAEVNVTAIGGDTQSATDLKDFADAGYDPATNKVQGVVLVDTTTTNTDMVSEPPTAAAVADQVWDEAKAGHVGAGSFGEEVQAHALSSEVTALNDLSAAEVNAEVVDVMATDTHAEITGAPSASPTYKQMLQWLYKNWRNRKTQTATTWTLYDDDTTTADVTATVSDDGTTATKGEAT